MVAPSTGRKHSLCTHHPHQLQHRWAYLPAPAVLSVRCRYILWSGDKHIRAYLCMDLQHLTQQLHNSWDALFFCLTNFHHNTTPFHRLSARYAMPTCLRVHFLSPAATYFLYSITNSRQVNLLLRNFTKYLRFVRSADFAASLSGMCCLAQDVLCACSNAHCHHTL
mgnify:CR=1 FL=1